MKTVENTSGRQAKIKNNKSEGKYRIKLKYKPKNGSDIKIKIPIQDGSTMDDDSSNWSGR